MVYLNLQEDEGVILQTTLADFDDSVEESLDELILTNKSLICVVRKSIGFFKSTTETLKFPLSSIKIFDGKAQIQQINNDDSDPYLQIIMNSGQRLAIMFEDYEKDSSKWMQAMLAAIAKNQTSFAEQHNVEKRNERFIVGEDVQTDTPQEVQKAQNSVTFCKFCGAKLDLGARFCKKCGQSVEEVFQSASAERNAEIFEDQTVAEKPITERQVVFEGKIHKCPSCGEILKSFVANCPACGYEIRDAVSTSSVKKFALKLENIENRAMPMQQEGSVMKKLFGRDFKKEDEEKEARRVFEAQKDQEKATLILNFPIPNTREDILEFMLLIATNIDTIHGFGDATSKAWITKLEQVYQKAKISMGNGTDFEQIEHLYREKKNQIRRKKLRPLLIGASVVLGYLILGGLLWNPIATIVIIIVLVIFGVAGYRFVQEKYMQGRR